jgi:3',5'-cyclic AMP phosphodiesterase CpdA
LVRIAQLTDLHLSVAERGRVFGSDVWGNLARVLGHVQALGIDHLVLTGDIANSGGRSVYERLRPLLLPFGDRVLMLPGNHDRRAALRAVFAALWPAAASRLGFEAELGGCTLLGLDSVHEGRTRGELGQQQLQWLAGRLAASTRPVVLFLHHTPVRVGCWFLDKDLLRDRVELAALLRPKPPLAIFTGHVHQAHELEFAGVPVFTTPSVAYQYAPRSWVPLPRSWRPALRILELAGGVLRSEVVRL